MDRNTKIMVLVVVFVSSLILVLESKAAPPSTPTGGQSDAQAVKDTQEALNGARGATRVYLASKHTFQHPKGGVIELQGNVQIGADGKVTADYIKYSNGELSNAQGFEPDGKNYKVESADRIEQDGNILTNAKGVTYQDGVLKADKADSFIKDNSVTTNINNLNSQTQFFSVDSADSFLSDCIRIDSIENSEFEVGTNVKGVQSNTQVL